MTVADRKVTIFFFLFIIKLGEEERKILITTYYSFLPRVATIVYTAFRSEKEPSEVTSCRQEEITKLNNTAHLNSGI